MKTGAVLERGKGRDYYDFIFLSGLSEPDFEKLVFDPGETKKVLFFKEFIRQKLDQLYYLIKGVLY